MAANGEGDDDDDLAFAYYYGLIGTTVNLLLAAAVLLSGIEPAGAISVSPLFLICAALIEVAKIAAAKRLSGHSAVFCLPRYADALLHSKPRDPAKGTLLRRNVLRVKKLVFRLKPYRQLLHGAVLLVLAWTATAYVVVCFGAPVFSQQYETASFSALLTLLSVLPPILVLGPEKVALADITTEEDAISSLLYRNGCGAVVGAWLGAFPIPLDWDRPWQAWPTTCAVGAVVGSTVAALWSLADARMQQHSDKKKKQK